MINKPVFKNRANEEVELKDGRQIWISRAPAVVGVILGIVNDNIYVLTEKRSDIMDEPNKWAVVSGYLDWEENGIEGIIRETYEETSFYIPDHKHELIFDNDEQPFYVHTDPKTDALQNVSLSYIFIYEFKELPIEVESFKDKEIDQVKWMEISEILKDNKDWAFSHDRRIEFAVEKYKEYLI